MRVLPFVAYGLSRTRLDASLLDLAAREGAEVRRGAGVRSLARTDGGTWQALLSDGQRMLSRTVVLASGKHELRGHQRVWQPGSGCVGFKMHWRLLPEQETALGRGIELFLHPNGYAGLQPIDAGMVNLCLVMDVTTFQTLGASFRAALAHLRQLIPTLDERLREAIPLWSTPASVAGLPYGYVCRASDCADGLYRVGDQLAVIPSFTGEGIAIALRSARLAAAAIKRRRAVEGLRGDGSAPAALADACRRFARNDDPASGLRRAGPVFCSMRRRSADPRPRDPAAGQHGGYRPVGVVRTLK